jgi:lycopene beta-cyclase
LSQQNKLGASIFGKMFLKNRASQILKFLDEETSFVEDLKIQLKMPIWLFTKALLKRIF